jgi:hypothetical protein
MSTRKNFTSHRTHWALLFDNGHGLAGVFCDPDVRILRPGFGGRVLLYDTRKEAREAIKRINVMCKPVKVTVRYVVDESWATGPPS